MLLFNEGLKKLLKESMDAQDYECQMLIMAMVVKFLRREILSSKSSPFTGSFLPECQNQSVPAALKLFVSMLLDGYQKKNNACHKLHLTYPSLYTSMQEVPLLLRIMLIIPRNESLLYPCTWA